MYLRFTCFPEGFEAVGINADKAMCWPGRKESWCSGDGRAKVKSFESGEIWRMFDTRSSTVVSSPLGNKSIYRYSMLKYTWVLDTPRNAAFYLS